MNSPKSICTILHTLVLGCQKRPMAPVLGIEASTASWGAACVYIVVHKVGAFIPVTPATATVLLGETQGIVHKHRQRVHTAILQFELVVCPVQD